MSPVPPRCAPPSESLLLYLATMGRAAGNSSKKKAAPVKIVAKDARKGPVNGKKAKQAVEQDDMTEESEDENYMAFNKAAKDSDDEDYDRKREVFDLNLKDDDDDEVSRSRSSDHDSTYAWRL